MKSITIEVKLTEYLKLDIQEFQELENFENIVKEINNNMRIHYEFVNENLELTFINKETKVFENSYIRFPKIKTVIMPLHLEHYLLKILLFKEIKNLSQSIYIENNNLIMKLKFRIE